ncbi:unnamed protein product [Pelagomonas calceolata]|uniref:Uncharacterized protein n=1 Tax=Pelagomonas calceolata TaxID=35677 RepID=A0A8J2X534_9STRA|nr:unnamed protein product [Pelagomonas calceolata]
MHGASRRRRRRARLHRLLRKLHAQRNRKTSALVGIWDGCIADEPMAALMHAAQEYWTQRGGDRTVAKSSWLPRGATPRSQLEALALGVLRAHVPDETPRDAVAGAEYWVQIRQRRDGGLGFHFDKDERAHAERGEWRHPLLATATYLGESGAPLVVFDTASEGKGRVRRGWLVAPRTARHVAFLGDRLHGVPAELAPENLLASRIKCAKDDPGTTRISVLVNLWDRKPVGVSRAAPYRGSTLPIDVSFAQPVAPPIVVQPKDHHIRRLGDANTHLIPGTENYAYLAEHRDGDTLPIPITRWIHSLAGGIPGWALELRSGD